MGTPEGGDVCLVHGGVGRVLGVKVRHVEGVELGVEHPRVVEGHGPVGLVVLLPLVLHLSPHLEGRRGGKGSERERGERERERENRGGATVSPQNMVVEGRRFGSVSASWQG